VIIQFLIARIVLFVRGLYKANTASASESEVKPRHAVTATQSSNQPRIYNGSHVDAERREYRNSRYGAVTGKGE
jgi:hypothetical protein